MSDIVADIITESKSVAATTLGASYHELPFVYDLERNNVRVGKLGYGIRPLAAASAEGVNRSYTMDHQFEFALMNTITRDVDDSEAETAIGVLYDKADEIFKALVQTKINLSSTVLNISDPSILEPQFFKTQKTIALRMQFTVKYRSALN